jgi:hypothetical protein
MRNPERTLSFLKTAAEIEGEVWNDNTQCKYQTLLIKNRFYTPTAGNLSDELYALVTNYSHEMTFAEADAIFRQKQYVDAPMRGRTSFDPLEKLGLVSLDENGNGVKCVRITDFGRMFINEEIDLGDVVFASLLKTQFPNPLENTRRDYNIKPFIGTLRLIKRVNELCVIQEINAVGISREEFGIFGLSLKSYLDIEQIAHRVVAFRSTKRSLPTEEEKSEFVHNYITDYLRNFQNPHKNVKEYTDNIIRYLRLTKYIYIRGGGYYIDLEPRRMIEINAILHIDIGAARTFTENEYKQYIGDYYAYTLPFETVEALTEIARRIVDENNAIAENLGIATREVDIPVATDELRLIITELREHRTELHNLQIRNDYQDAQRIDEVITALSNTLNRNVRVANRPSVELEKWANIALNILNDAMLIKPNAPLGDDNEPTFTAPANVPDIECYYNGFGAICEVTMLTGRDQWYNEGQPVMRHLRDFENNNTRHENYCLFVAPKLHVDTLNTFWMSVKYEYEGKSQKIIPITISNLIELLNIIKNLKLHRKTFTHENLKHFYDRCVNITNVVASNRWTNHINTIIGEWGDELLN